jgi:hypothetical protein
MPPLQCLDPRLLVDADDVDAPLGQQPGPLIQVTDRLGLLTKDLRVKRVGIEPVAAAMRLQVGLSLRTAPRSAGRCP